MAYIPFPQCSEVFWGLSKSSWERDTLWRTAHVIWRTACAALGRRPAWSAAALHSIKLSLPHQQWEEDGKVQLDTVRPVEHRETKATGPLWYWGGWWQNRPCGSISWWHQQPGAEVRAGSGTTWLRWLKTLGLYRTLVAIHLFSPTSAIVHGRGNGKDGWGRDRWVGGVEMFLFAQFA